VSLGKVAGQIWEERLVLILVCYSYHGSRHSHRLFMHIDVSEFIAFAIQPITILSGVHCLKLDMIYIKTRLMEY
jgi:hypothetical protein